MAKHLWLCETGSLMYKSMVTKWLPCVSYYMNTEEIKNKSSKQKKKTNKKPTQTKKPHHTQNKCPKAKLNNPL